MEQAEERRRQIVRMLEGERKPLSGTEIARRLHVSRQVIVQDIALLRAGNRNILSTNKGYLLYQPQEHPKFRRTFYVEHGDERIEEELYTIVDCGGRLLDVVVEHEIYGQITVDLIITSRQDAREFANRLREHGTRGLNALTYGRHYHTVEADKEEYLDLIGERLREKGFLAESLDFGRKVCYPSF